MKVVIASDSYKESLKAIEVCEAIERGFGAIFPKAEYVKIPIGDGGEGTVDSLVDATGGSVVSLYVTGPLREGVQAFMAFLQIKRQRLLKWHRHLDYNTYRLKSEIHSLQRQKGQESLYYMR